MIKAVCIDLDNTLIANQYLYEEAQAALRGYMRHFGVLSEDVNRVFDALDKELFGTHGYSRVRMPASFEAVLKHFVADADAEMVEIVRSFAEEIFDTVARMKPGTLEAMELLTGRYPVYIVTAGDKGVQENRIRHLPFKDALAGAFVVDRKDRETYLEIADRLGFKPEEIVMIGDSLKSDVIAAASAGLQAVWIEEHNSPHEAAEKLPAAGAYKFSCLPEAARHIVRHGTPTPVPASRKKSSPKLK